MESNPIKFVPWLGSPDEPYRVDAEVLWSACVQWAHQPRPGILVPVEVAAQIARSVMETALLELPRETAQIEISAFCQRLSRNLALARVALERQERKDGHFWHDDQWQPNESRIDLEGLKLDDNQCWQVAMPILRRLAMPDIRRCGVSSEDAEDVFAETLAALIAIGPDARRLIDELKVVEQLPPLFKTIAGRRAADHLRRRSAQKRDVALEVALDGEDPPMLCHGGGQVLTEHDLCDILERSSLVVTPAQWEVITRLIVHASDTHSSLIADARLMTSLAIDFRGSEATRRRRLRDSLDDALSKIRKHLDLP